MNACARVEHPAPVLADRDERESLLAHLIEQRAQIGQVGHPEQAAGIDVQRAEQLAHDPREVPAQPRHAAELERVSRLVQRHPAQQLVRVGLQRRRRMGEVGRHEQQPRRPVGIEDRELVLTEHAAAEEAGDRARLDRQKCARGRADRAELGAEPVGHRVQDAADPAQVRVDPLRAGDRLGHAAAGSAPPGRCTRRPAARFPLRVRASSQNGAGSPAGCRLAMPRATCPARLQSITLSSLARSPARPGPLPSARRRRASAAGDRAARRAGRRTR